MDTGRARRIWIWVAVGVVAVAIVIRVSLTAGRLPTGSDLRRFDRATWQAPQSTAYLRDDITPRQKMLGDVVANVLPGRTREELEQILGPSLDTPYFRSSGRDLIYVLGPERGSFFAIDSNGF